MGNVLSVSVEEAGARLADLIEAARGGDEVILTRDSVAVARVVPDTPAPEPHLVPRLGTAAGLVWMAEDFDALPEGFEEYV